MRKYWPLISLILLFILPALTAFCLLTYKNNFSFNTAQHGIFVQPTMHISLTHTELIAGDSTDNKWVIMTTYNNDKHYAVLKKLHVALGAQRERVTIVSSTEDGITPRDAIIILNPQHIAVLQYDDLTNLSGLLKDIRRLLKYSHV